MRWHSQLSTAPAHGDALAEVLAGAAAALGGVAPQLAVCLLSADHAASAVATVKALVRRWPGVVVLGGVVPGLVGGARELEAGPGLSLTVGVLPGVEVTPFVVRGADLPDLPASPSDWPGLAALDPDLAPAFIVLVDPASIRVDLLLQAMDGTWPRAPLVGGLASGSAVPGGSAFFCGDRVVRGGAVGVALTGDVVVEPLVAQGARPVGPTFVATRTRGNLVLELDGRPAIPKLEELFVGLAPADRDRFRRGPLVGLGPVGTTATRPGDFLLRDLLGLDRDAGAFGVAWPVGEGQALRFHVRDPEAATEELREHLGRLRSAPPAGALLFSCLGRGEGFFGEADHDSRLYREATGSTALGGFFCNGEIGPVRGHPYLHGYTSAFALFRPRGWD